MNTFGIDKVCIEVSDSSQAIASKLQAIGAISQPIVACSHESSRFRHICPTVRFERGSHKMMAIRSSLIQSKNKYQRYQRKRRQSHPRQKRTCARKVDLDRHMARTCTSHASASYLRDSILRGWSVQRTSKVCNVR